MYIFYIYTLEQNKKYFRYITYEEAGELDDFADDELDNAGIMIYNVIEL